MKKANLFLVLSVAVGLVASVVVYSSAQIPAVEQATLVQPGTVKGMATEAEATIIIRGLDEKVTERLEQLPTKGATALDLLTFATRTRGLELKTKSYEGLGALVEAIGQATNGQDNKYWSFYINGEFAQVSADQYQLKVGDVIEFRFEASKF